MVDPRSLPDGWALGLRVEQLLCSRSAKLSVDIPLEARVWELVNSLGREETYSLTPSGCSTCAMTRRILRRVASLRHRLAPALSMCWACCSLTGTLRGTLVWRLGRAGVWHRRSSSPALVYLWRNRRSRLGGDRSRGRAREHYLIRVSILLYTEICLIELCLTISLLVLQPPHCASQTHLQASPRTTRQGLAKRGASQVVP